MSYRVPILSLKPTQFSLGMEQIKVKTADLETFSRKKLAKYLHRRPVPVVVSPKGEIYVIDRHHLLYACWHIGVKKIGVEIKCDLSKSGMSYKKFWETMIVSRWAYLFDQFGEGPRDPLYLPQDIRGLADDPYRSLAWAVRKAGGYDHADQTFAEFDWANFFRRYQLLESTGRAGFEDAVKKGLKLASSPHADKLPGYKGKTSIPNVEISSHRMAA
jgi:hypothetical protein